MSSNPEPQPVQPTPRSPRASFSILPYELRHQIWSYTFTPRLLCLHIHRRLAPPLVGPDGEYVDCPMRTVAVSFTCTVCTDPASNSGSPGAIFAAFATRVASKLQMDKLDSRMGSLSGPSSLGPVALYVCRESRAIAMQTYELAFSGTDVHLDGCDAQSWELRRVEDKEEWETRRLGEKRIWVDFQRDAILVDGHYRSELYAKCSPREPLTVMRTYAKEEAKRIRRLAVGAVSGMSGKGERPFTNEMSKIIAGNMMYNLPGEGSHRPNTTRIQHIPAPGGLRNEYLLGFDSVEDFLLDDTVGTNDRNIDHPVLRRPRPPWNEKGFIFSLSESLKRESERGPWRVKVKRLEFVRGDEWNAYLEG